MVKTKHSTSAQTPHPHCKARWRTGEGMIWAHFAATGNSSKNFNTKVLWSQMWGNLSPEQQQIRMAENEENQGVAKTQSPDHIPFEMLW